MNLFYFKSRDPEAREHTIMLRDGWRQELSALIAEGADPELIDHAAHQWAALAGAARYR